MENFGLNLFSGIMMILAGTIPAFLALRTSGMIRMLLIVLLSFTLIHGLYHLLDIMGFEFVADSIIRPVSVAVLMLFGIFTLIVKRKNSTKRKAIKH